MGVRAALEAKIEGGLRPCLPKAEYGARRFNGAFPSGDESPEAVNRPPRCESQ